MKEIFKNKKFDYKWVIAVICFLMVFVSLGFCSSNKSVYIGAITEATGISRSLFSFNDTCRYVTTAIINIFFGSLIEKYGAKKLVLFGFGSLICSSLLYSIGNEIFVFYLGGVCLGIGVTFTTTAMVGCIVNRWFKKNKGTIMGAVLASNGLGGALAAQIIYPIIYQENNLFGYRTAYRLVAVILFVVAIIVAIFLKDQPKNEERTKFQVAKKKPKGESWYGIDFSEVKKHKFFYIAMACTFITGIMLVGINGVAAAHLRDMELDATYIALVLSIHSIALTVFKFLVGFMYDRLGLRFTTILCSLAGVLTMFSLVLLSNTVQGKVFAMTYGIVSSLAQPLETVMIPIIVGDMFGEKSFNKIMGIFMTVNYTGFALGNPAMNFVYDILGSYRPAFFVCGILMIAVTIVLQFAIIEGHKLRKNFVVQNQELQNSGV